MKAKADPEFWRRYNYLPAKVQDLAQKNYSLWLTNPFHPSLQFKEIVWDWIGTHEEYNKF